MIIVKLINLKDAEVKILKKKRVVMMRPDRRTKKKQKLK